ncbi:MAG: tetratricopeptide repeat protein [Terriglobus sp.]
MELRFRPQIAGRLLLGFGTSALMVFALLPTRKTYAGQTKAAEHAAQAPQYAAPVYAPAAIPAHAELDPERKKWADMIRRTYDFSVMTDNISLPGNAQVEGGDFIQPGAFPTAQYCGHCHNEAFAEWRQSLHSNSFRTPFYRTSVNIVINTKGIQFSRHCDSCHNPIAVLSGALTKNSMVDRRFDQDGVTCMTCHAIGKVQSTLGNGGYVMNVPSVITDAQGNRIPGEVSYKEILAHTDRHVAAVMRPLMKQPEFCAACHKANLPDTLNEYKWIRAFTTYDEWQNSKFSQQNPLTFYKADYLSCQGCHMGRMDISLEDPGAKHGTLASHRWTAGNLAVPTYYRFDDQTNKTIEFLKRGTFLNVDLFGVKINGGKELVAPLGERSFSVKSNDVAEAYVVIQNKNIGHSLVPEVRDLFEAWLEFEAKDTTTGKVIYHSGYLKPDGSLDESAHSFTNRPVNTDGVFVDNHKVWTIHSMAYDNTVQAGRSVLVRYEFRIPSTVKQGVSMTARVNYRHLRHSYTDNVFGKGSGYTELPIVEIASRTRLLAMGENPPERAIAGDNPVWMRWNNLGIALLDQLQYGESLMAFGEAMKLHPDDADVYTNIALTNIQWEKFDAAHTALDKALQLNPGNARALYYMALVERRDGNTAQEIADLKQVVAQYPRSVDARRELGVSYYQSGDQRSAMEQFEELQRIDPDDVAAHYNLSLLYRRNGKKDAARQQAALFATKKTDPGAPTYSQDFLRLHPEISTESIPWHIHSSLHSTHPTDGSAVTQTPQEGTR